MVVYCVPGGISDPTHVVVFVVSFNSSVSYKVIVNCNRVHIIHHSRTMFLENSQILFILRRGLERIGLSLKHNCWVDVIADYITGCHLSLYLQI